MAISQSSFDIQEEPQLVAMFLRYSPSFNYYQNENLRIKNLNQVVNHIKLTKLTSKK